MMNVKPFEEFNRAMLRLGEAMVEFNDAVLASLRVSVEQAAAPRVVESFEIRASIEGVDDFPYYAPQSSIQTVAVARVDGELVKAYGEDGFSATEALIRSLRGQ